jgi:hypothetical protein
MENKLYDRSHVREYLLYGLLAALGFIVCVVIFLINNRYENLIWVYAGSILFATVIGIYNYIQIKRPMEGKGAVRMLIASHFAILTGVLLATIFSVLSMYMIFGDLGEPQPTETILKDADPASTITRPAGLLMMILIYGVVTNFAVSSFLTVVISYVFKRNQTKDKPAELDKTIHVIEK